jgi:hypothetical protein
MVNELHEPAELMGAALRIAAFNDDRDPVFRDADY